MAEIFDIFKKLYEGIKPAVDDCGLTPDFPAGVSKAEIPFNIEGGKAVLSFKGEGKAAKIEHSGNTVILYGAFKDGEIVSGDFGVIQKTLLDVNDIDDKGVNSLINDFSETLRETFGNKNAKAAKLKLPTPVSKAAVQSGSLSYDPNTLASRLTGIYPELKPAYKANIERYGSFLPEDFFINHANSVILNTIKNGTDNEVKRLFKLFNEIYDNGTNETQSLICVTILGSVENDMELLARMVDFMSDDLKSPVIKVNEYLASRDGRGARMKLENPPIYKPKKAKKKKNGPMSNIGL